MASLTLTRTLSTGVETVLGTRLFTATCLPTTLLQVISSLVLMGCFGYVYLRYL